MASEEIKLIGSFKDDITPKLKKLTKQIDAIGRSFSKFNRNLRPISREFGRMAASAERFNTAMKSQRSALAANARAMSEYKKQAGRMAGAMRSMENQRAKAMRAQGVTRAQQKGGGGGVTPMPTTPAAGKGTGKAFGATAGASFKQSIGATAIGTSIGMMASQAIMSGVQGLKNLALAPFKKFGAMFSERISDEMDDIKSAGGLFALDMDLTQASGNERFFKNYNSALRFQEKLNIDMAQSAASLPGVTSQYVSTSRQLTDTLQMTMEKDRGEFGKLAQQFGGNVTGDGTVRDSQESMRTVLQKMTEQVMLQSQGQQGGLPMHIAIQQLMGKEQGKIKMQAFTNKFRAAFQKNPLLKNFLLRAESEMNSTAAGSAERLKVIMETFDKAMPKEVINKMRGSISGMQEALRSGLLDPQAGLFGMSRANLLNGQEIMKKNVDDFGNVLYEITSDIGIDDEFAKKLKAIGIDKAAGDTLKEAELTAEQIKKLGFSLDKTGKVIGAGGKEIGKISESSTYIFEQIREILAGYGPVLLEFVGELPGLFDPFGAMTNNLKDFRDNAQKFISGFNSRLDLIEDAALEFSNMADPAKKGVGATLKKQSRGRAAMDTVASYLKGIGAINDDLFQEIRGKAQDFSEAGIAKFEKEGFGDAIGKLLKATLESDLMKEFGKIGGIIIGGITKAVVDVIKMVSGAAKGKMGNKLTEGFIEGFKTAFGDMDFGEVKGIFTDVIVSVLSKGLDLIFNNVLPNLLQMYVGSLFKGLFSGNIITMLFSGLGLVKFVGVLAPLLTTLGAGLTYLSPLFISFGGILMTVITAAAPLVAIVALIAGVVMGVVAIFRHLDFITSSVVEAFKLIVNTFMWIDATIKAAVLNFAASLMEGLANVPMIGGAFKGGAESARGAADAASATADAIAQEMGASLSKIGENTAASFARTAEDADMLAKAFGMTGDASTAVGDAFRGAAEVTESASQEVSTALVGAATESGNAITGAASGLAKALSSAAQSIANAANAAPKVAGPGAETKYDGKGGKMMPLAAAIQKERQMMPAGANLVIANSSETVIPAFNGHAGDGFKGLSFEELESAAGFDRMKSYTEQVADIADKTAASFSGGFGGALGGGSATLNAMEALGHSFGLTTTSGHRPGDPGFHGVNRARDLSNGGGETPEMNAAAAKMASEFGSSLTELIYTPMGFSIKNGQKTGLISPDNHFHHIHVAVAEGLQKAAVFSSQKAAEAYERSMMPSGAEPMKVNLGSMTANSSEFGGGVTMGDLNVSVSGVNDPKAIANQVAEEILFAIEKSTYSEVFTS